MSHSVAIKTDHMSLKVDSVATIDIPAYLYFIKDFTVGTLQYVAIGYHQYDHWPSLEELKVFEDDEIAELKQEILDEFKKYPTVLSVGIDEAPLPYRGFGNVINIKTSDDNVDAINGLGEFLKEKLTAFGINPYLISDKDSDDSDYVYKAGEDF